MRLLDLYCCGGGAGYGYELAGFRVTGVDNRPQPKHRGEFVLSDAIEYLINNHHNFDAVHASPPCQQWSRATIQHRKMGRQYVDLIEATRVELKKTNLPYVIENVEDAPLENPIILCGAMFGLKMYRHRKFESNIPITTPTHPLHLWRQAPMGRPPGDGEFIQMVGHFSDVDFARRETGLYWLGQEELAQCIPPAYTKYIGMQLIRHINQHNVQETDAFPDMRGCPICGDEECTSDHK